MQPLPHPLPLTSKSSAFGAHCPVRTEGTPQPAVDPAGRIRELVSSGGRGEAVAFWMSEVVGLPGEMLAQMDGAPWVRSLEPLTPTLPYDLAVADGGVPVAELGKITAPVLILHGARDQVVPFVMGERMFELTKAPKNIVRFLDGDHQDLDAQGALHAVGRFLAGDLDKAPRPPRP